jgi:serine protease Do
MGMLSKSETITDDMLWAYPLPETIGITLDPEAKATITHVEKGSDAVNAGLERGDEILTIQKQPILSIADIQWVLHRAEDKDALAMVIERGGTEHSLTLNLPAGWRRRGEFVERPSSWDLFKVKLFGVAEVETLSGKEKTSLELGHDQMALRVKKLSPSWGGINNDVQKAGLKPGDVIVQVDEKTDLKDHSELLAYLVQRKKFGETLTLILLREGQRKRIQVPLNWSNRIKALRSP